jgi:creatinine amidohydrolase
MNRAPSAAASTPAVASAAPPRFWADLSTREFDQRLASGLALQTVAVLPVAATEQHGPHLPVSVDATLVDGIVAASLPHLPASLPVLFLPTQAVGKSDEHLRFPGTLTLSADTLIRVWTEIGESVARAGVRRLVLFNSHGGQVSVMDIVARELRQRCDMLVFSTNWYTLPLGEEAEGRFPPEEHRFGIHAGDIETSMMLALRPERVDMTQARDFRSTAQERAARYPILGNGRSAKLGWQMQDYHPAGAAGNAAAATAAKGRAMVEAAGLQLARLLQEVAQLPLSTLVDRPDLSR